MDKKTKYQDQIDKISKQIVKEPDNVSLYIERADLYKKIQRKDKKSDKKYYKKKYEEDKDKIFSLIPNALEDMFMQADFFKENREYKRAISGYTKLINKGKNIFWLYYERGLCFFDLNNYFEAIKDLTDAEKLYQDKKEKDFRNLDYIYAYRGLSHFFLEKYVDAYSDFLKLLNKKTLKFKEIHILKTRSFNQYQIPYYYAISCYFTGKYKEALIHLNEIIESDPQNYMAIFYRSKTYKMLGFQDKVVEDENLFEKALHKDSSLYEDIGYYYYEMNEWDKALDCFRKVEYLPSSEAIEIIKKISNYYLNIGEYDKARKVCEGYYEDNLDEVWGKPGYSLHEHLQSINDKQKEFEIFQAKIEAKEKAHKEMLSFFTHTLNNALGTGDNTIQDIIMDFEKDKYIKNKEINIYRLNSLFANFSLIRSLIKSYKIYIQDPEYFNKSWEKDSSGDANIDWVFVYTLRQVISQLLFIKDPDILNRLQMGTGNFNNKEEMKKENQRIRKSFINDILLTKINKVNISEILSWFTINLPFIKLEIKAPKLNFGLENIRFGLFFACFSEIINNALKYSDGKNPIELEWKEDSKYYIFQSRNTYNSETSFSNDIKEIKSQKGIHFIERLMNMFADSKIKSSELVKVDMDDNYFIFSVKYPKNKMN